MTTIDIEALRSDTPGCKNVVHFNNAGAALMPLPVFDAVTGHLKKELESGGYEAAASAKTAIEDFYPAVAALLNALPQEIAYVENATRAWDMACYAIPFQQGDQVIIHHTEYASNYLALLQIAQAKGIELEFAPSNPWGQVDVEGLEKLITPQTRLIAITHVPSTTGLINPAAEIGEIANRHNILYLLDACQSVGQMPVDVKKIGCDMLAATGRKFLRGPRGTGFLYVNQRITGRLHPPFIDLQAAHWPSTDSYQLREDARRFENWERFIAGQIGLAAAVRYALQIGVQAIRERVAELVEYLYKLLGKIKCIRVQEPIAVKPYLCSGIVTIAIQNHDVEDLLSQLRKRCVHVSVVLEKNARLNLLHRCSSSFIRISPHYYNTTGEMDTFCEALVDLIKP